eukprot:TRINITY_DN22877_c0_g1_i1.p1 TRINITY_DN22877_c0_g1~~TRINITY_DN22877_c0_g1_i1.p1  ORF type:complete len:813 (-),score=142.82 TRINITY_DN22877_c0_g1_i1:120-2558(-)
MATVFPRGDDKSIRTARKCTDAQCIGVFAIVLAAMGFFTYWSVAQESADSDRLTHAMDYDGRICGKSSGVQDKPYLYVCGASNAGTTGAFPNSLDFKSKTCVSSCPGLNQTLIPCIARPFVFPRERNCATEGCVENGVQIRKSVTWEISQSISYQSSYPTELYRGELCVPQWDAPYGLRDSMISGPTSSVSQQAQAFGSILHALPVLGIVFLFATLLSLSFLFVMSHFAAPVLFIALGLGAFMVGFVGCWLTVGIFFSPFDETGGYQQWNPIYRSVYGESARVLTFFLGLVNIGVCVLMCRATQHSIGRVDEAVGMIHAAFEFVFPHDRSSLFFLLLVPFLSAAVVCILMGVLIFCYTLMLSAGAVEAQGVWINGKPYPSLSKSVTKPLDGSLWDVATFIYGFGMIWFAEVMVGVIQYVTSYCVCTWFFVPIQPKDIPDNSSQPFIDAYEKYGTKVDVRVQGVDAVVRGGKRTGYIEDDAERGRGQVLVVPIGQTGPDGGDFYEETAEIEIKKHECDWVCEALGAALGPNLGSLIYLAWPVFLSRPFRMIAEVLKFLLTPPSDNVIRNAYIEDDPKTLYDIIVALGGLVAGFVNHWFGGYSRDAHADIILRGVDAMTAAGDVQEFVLKAGGVVAFMHGMTRIYEIIGVFFTAGISSFVGFSVMTSVSSFRDADGSLYVEDPMAMTFLCMLVSTLVAFNWMSLFSNTSDTLLYVFLWTRKQLAKDDGTMPPLDWEACEENGKQRYCPSAILSILQTETDEAPAEAFKAGSKSNLTRFNHAHKKFFDSAAAFATGKNSNLFGDGERDSLLQNPR